MNCCVSMSMHCVKFAQFAIRELSNARATMSAIEKPIESAIIDKLQQNLKPSVLKVLNESYMHNVPKGAETHFKVIIVSDTFKDLPLIKRHRKVNDILKDELQGGVHALSIVAKTPDQWTDEEIEPSPNCRGGFGK